MVIGSNSKFNLEMNLNSYTFQNSFVYIPYSVKFRRRIFRNFTLKQTFHGIKFPICVLIVHVCALILTISQINFCKMDQIMKNMKFQPRKNFPLYGNSDLSNPHK